MATLRSLSRKVLWLGLAGVLLPLVVLLALQYRWLRELQENTALAQKAMLDNYLEAVTAEVEHHYREVGNQVLNLSPQLFTAGGLEQAPHVFYKKDLPEARRFFVIAYRADDPANFGLPRFYSRSCQLLAAAAETPEMHAVLLATVPFKMAAVKQIEYDSATPLKVDDSTAQHRIVLNPILDEGRRVVGVAGMILDERYFRSQVLPAAITAKLELFRRSAEQPMVVVTDRSGEEIYRRGEAHRRALDAARPLAFVWSDWRIGVAGCHPMAEKWARRNFAINLGLSALLSGALVLGVLLALRAASREMRLSQMKSDFVSNVSHELRTPLASIRVFGELLRLGRADSLQKTREYGEYIETESRRLSQLINNILDFGSIESGRKQYRFEPTDLAELVERTLQTFEVRLRQSGFALRFEPSAVPFPPLQLDGGAIAQSLSNLLDNAVKYSGEGREIVVGLGCRDGWGELWVRDRGIGIPKAEQRKIFDRFHRVCTGLVHDVKGSGLGLAIVQHIAQAHGGRVTVDSRPGEGSTFTLHLPLPLEPELAPARAALGPSAAEASS